MLRKCDRKWVSFVENFSLYTSLSDSCCIRIDDDDDGGKWENNRKD